MSSRIHTHHIYLFWRYSKMSSQTIILLNIHIYNPPPTPRKRTTIHCPVCHVVIITNIMFETLHQKSRFHFYKCLICHEYQTKCLGSVQRGGSPFGTARPDVACVSTGDSGFSYVARYHTRHHVVVISMKSPPQSTTELN